MKHQHNQDHLHSDGETTSAEPTDPHVNHPRLPCRGCVATCKNYDYCDGKPWRMAE